MAADLTEKADQGEAINMNYFHWRNKYGQALVEVMICIVVVMVLVSAILQIALMSKAHTDVMVEARSEAGNLAMTDLSQGMNLLADPEYIRDWFEGPDTRRLSRDDEHDAGDPGSFQSTIVNASVHDPSGWDIIDAAPYNRLSMLHADPLTVNSLGLVKGSASSTLSLEMLPAFRHLVYRSGSVELEATAWMTLCKGVY